MKQRYNISVDVGVMEKAKETIENVSAFIEACLRRHNANIKAKEEHNLTDEDVKKLDGLYNIANTKWTD